MRVRFLACALAATLLAAAPLAQTPSPAGSGTVGFMHAIHATNVVEKTLAFYTEVFGLSGQVRPFANEAVPILTDSPGVTLKVSMLQLPGEGFNFELTEFSNVTRTPAQPQIWDPGAPHMKILVRDLEPVVAAVRKLGAPMLTTSRAPVALSTPIGNVKAIMFRDPDGYIVEAVQAQAPANAPAVPASAPATGNVAGAIMGLTVEDMDTAMKFWHDLLGFELSSPVSCAGFVPSYGTVGAYYQLDNPNPSSLPQYADQMRLLTAGSYAPAVNAYLASHTPPPPTLVTTMVNSTGVKQSLWNADFNVIPTFFDNSFQLSLIPGTLIGRYDARVNVPVSSPLAADGDPSSSFITKPFTDTIGKYLPNELKYTAQSAYSVSSNAINTWDWTHDGLAMPDTIPDLAAALSLNPQLKVLSLNGYHDIATPFYQTELDLARLGTQPNLTIKDYQGGHMVYLDDTSRPQEKADLVTFYNAAAH